MSAPRTSAMRVLFQRGGKFPTCRWQYLPLFGHRTVFGFGIRPGLAAMARPRPRWGRSRRHRSQALAQGLDSRRWLGDPTNLQRGQRPPWCFLTKGAGVQTGKHRVLLLRSHICSAYHVLQLRGGRIPEEVGPLSNLPERLASIGGRANLGVQSRIPRRRPSMASIAKRSGPRPCLNVKVAACIQPLRRCAG
jgi:hypothetical protein